jgi:hypothetical protein
MKRKIEAGKQFPGQHPEEEVEIVFHQHPIVMRKSLIASLVVLTLGAVPLAIWPLSNWPWWVFLGGFVLSSIVFLYRWIGWYYSIFIITNERLIQIKQKGFFDRRVSDISHTKIQSVNYEMTGLQATMFHFGTIIVQTYAGNLVLPYIHHPADIHQMLSKIMREVRPGSHPNPNEVKNNEEEE